MHNGHVSVKEAVLPFARFAGADSVLGPEMKSTGEVMGIAGDFPTAFGKAQAAAGVTLPTEGTVFITVTDNDKAAATQLATRFHDLGFEIIATKGTAQAISRMGIPVRAINKIVDGSTARGRLHPQPRGRSRDQHAHRRRRPLGRLRDPHRGGAQRDSLPHDDDRRLRAAARSSPCASGGGAAVAPGATPRTAARRRRTADDRAGAAPFGRRRCAWSPTRRAGDTGCLRLDTAARRRAPASSTCWPRTAGAARTGGPTSRARSPSPRRRRADGVGSTSSRRRPGPGCWPALAPVGAGLHVTGPLGRPFSLPLSSPRGGRGDPGRRRDRDRNAGASAARALRAGDPTAGPARLSRSCPRGRAGSLSLLGGADGVRGRPHRSPGLRHRPARGPAGGDDAGSAVVYACGPPAMLEAVRELCAARRARRARARDADGLRLRSCSAAPCRSVTAAT